MSKSSSNSCKRRPRAATVSIIVGILAWLSPLIALIGGMFINSGGQASAGDGGPNLIWIVHLIFGAIATGVLGIIGSLICLLCGTQFYPDEKTNKTWIIPKLLNYPVGFLDSLAEYIGPSQYSTSEQAV